MYIDPELEDYITMNYGIGIDIEKIVENCGIWYTLDGIKAEWEEYEATLEEIVLETYFIIEDNKMLFCTSEILDDIKDYILENGNKR